MTNMTAAVIVEWALGCQNRAVHREPPGPVRFLDAGPERLVDLTVWFTAGPTEPRRGDDVQGYFRRLARLAVGVSRNVFAACGPETGRYLLLCLLSAARCRPVAPLRQDQVLACLEEANVGRLAELLDRTFRFSG